MYYVHKYEQFQHYGGPEEGGWWYDVEVPVISDLAHFDDEEDAYDYCRQLNRQEYERRDTLSVGYTSVLSSRETFYIYSVTEEPVAVQTPLERPHYE